MNIECKLRREGGTEVDIDGVFYRFRPDAYGRHVAYVENEDHLARFLSITEGYCIAKAIDAARVDIAPPETPVPSVPGANVHGIGPDTDGGPNPLYIEPVPAAVTRAASDASTTSAIPVAAEVEDDEAAEEDEASNIPAAVAAPVIVDDETAKQALRDKLAEEYKALFGRKPAYNKTVDSLVRDIAERKAAGASAAN